MCVTECYLEIHGSKKRCTVLMNLTIEYRFLCDECEILSADHDRPNSAREVVSIE